MGLTGIINLNKPRGWTSHDAVAKLRRLSGQRRVGHAGTLDPLAEGVLPILLGRATRLMDVLQAVPKAYRASVKLGVATSTDDAEGEITSSQAAPRLTAAVLEGALALFRGDIQQVPPAYSALKVQGQRAYAIARGGGTVNLPARPVTIYTLELVSFSEDAVVLDITCSKGTYIRSLARDLAAALGTVGHLASLVRTRVGPFTLENSVTLDDLAANGVDSALLPADAALPEAPLLRTSASDAVRFTTGQAVPATGLPHGYVRVYGEADTLLGIGLADGDVVRPRISLLP